MHVGFPNTSFLTWGHSKRFIYAVTDVYFHPDMWYMGANHWTTLPKGTSWMYLRNRLGEIGKRPTKGD
jgi:hypothetical protein